MSKDSGKKEQEDPLTPEEEKELEELEALLELCRQQTRKMLLSLTPKADFCSEFVRLPDPITHSVDDEILSMFSRIWK